jgi:hypothetical protein
MANIDTNTLLDFGEATKKNMKLAESHDRLEYYIRGFDSWGKTT